LKLATKYKNCSYRSITTKKEKKTRNLSEIYFKIKPESINRLITANIGRLLVTDCAVAEALRADFDKSLLAASNSSARLATSPSAFAG
jgi:hypothetical protein